MQNYIREYIRNEEFKLTLLQDRINILNYQELIEISTKEIIVTSKDAKLKITGENLVLSKLLDDEILLTGKVKNIEARYE